MQSHATDQLTIDRESTSEGFVVLHIKGWITLKNSDGLRSAIEEARGATVIVDLKDVPYMDSAGLGVLLKGFTGSQTYGGRFVLAGMVPRVRDLLQLTKVLPLFQVFDSSQAAIEAYRHGASA